MPRDENLDATPGYRDEFERLEQEAADANFRWKPIVCHVCHLLLGYCEREINCPEVLCTQCAKLSGKPIA